MPRPSEVAALKARRQQPPPPPPPPQDGGNWDWLSTPESFTPGGGPGGWLGRTIESMWGIDREGSGYNTYSSQGGHLSYNQWIKQGKPSGPTQIGPATEKFRKEFEQVGAPLPEPIQMGRKRDVPVRPSEQAAAMGAFRDLNLPPEPEEPEDPFAGLAGDQPTGEFEERYGYAFPVMKRADGSTYIDTNNPIPVRDTEDETYDAQRAANALAARKFRYEKGKPEREATVREEKAERAAATRLEEQKFVAEEARKNRQQQMDIAEQSAEMERTRIEAEQQWREQQVAAQREEQLANLRANPASWLEYAALAGETPVVQPWMMPLSPGDYNLQAGQALPGWGDTGATGAQGVGGQDDLPELTTPSAQFMSRLAPSSRQQFAGYQRARTGQSGEDVNWWMRQGAPPSGANRGLTRV